MNMITFNEAVIVEEKGIPEGALTIFVRRAERGSEKGSPICRFTRNVRVKRPYMTPKYLFEEKTNGSNANAGNR